MPIMTKMARTPRAIQVMGLMAGAVGCSVGGTVGCTVGGTVVGDAARRVRVKPLSRPQAWQMPPRSPDSGTPIMQTVYTHHMEAPEIDPQVRQGEGRSPLLTGL